MDEKPNRSSNAMASTQTPPQGVSQLFVQQIQPRGTLPPKAFADSCIHGLDVGVQPKAAGRHQVKMQFVSKLDSWVYKQTWGFNLASIFSLEEHWTHKKYKNCETMHFLPSKP